MKPPSAPRLFPTGRLPLLVLAVLAGCLQPVPPPPEQSSFAAVERRSAQLLRELQNPAAAGNTSVKSVVTIDGNDILLPEASPDRIESEQSYYFDVAADDPDNRAMRELLETGALRIETIGADATLVYPVITPADGSPAPAPLLNANKARLKVTTSKDGALRPFTIRAWYPAKMQSAHAEAWSATRLVKVYYGDIRTRVQIVSRTEAEGMFGATFAEHFFVGRVFLRNRSTTKSLAVYTTSMRVPVLFYRRSELPGGLAPAAAERLSHLAETRWSPDLPQDELIPNAKKVVTDFLERNRFTGTQRDPFDRGPEKPPTGRSIAGVSKDEFDALVARVLADWARLSDADKDRIANDARLTTAEQEALLDAALQGSIPSPAAKEEKLNLLMQTPQVKKQIRQDARVTSAGRDLVLRAWRLRKDLRNHTEKRLADLTQKLAVLHDRLPAAPAAAANAQAGQYDRILRTLDEINKLDTAAALAAYRQGGKLPASRETPASLAAAIREVIDDRDRADFSHAAASLPVLVRQCLEAEDLLAYLQSLDSGEPIAAIDNPAVKTAIDDLRERARWRRGADTADNGRHTPSVNLGAQSLALSPDPHLQRRLVEGGYVWRDAYRPMTFQAVLNSVMFSHAKDPRTVFVKVLEALATVAGGAVGISSDSDSGALRATNFFSSVLVPTLRATLVEDLNKHISNLGEMAMDTVIIIPPNDSVDRYVFFPRDAIYNFPDEFDPSSPGYIRGVEGDELFVEAVPVNSDQVVRGGAVDANTLVTRALNEGERSESARLLGVAETQARLRTVELSNLTARIGAVMDAAQKAADDPARPLSATEKEAVLQRARDEVGRMTAAFTAYFGPDQSGVLAATLTRYGVTLHDAPPVALPGDPLSLPAGTTSIAWPLNVTDSDTPLKSLRFEKKADAATDDWLSAVEFVTTDPQRVRAIITLKPAADEEPVRKELALTVTDGGGNTVGFIQPILRQPLALGIPVLTPQDREPNPLSTKPASSYSAKIGHTRATLALSVPIHDANPALLKLALPSDASPFVESVRAGRDASTKTLTLLIQLDTSAATAADDDASPTLTVSLVPADTPNTAAALDTAALAQTRIKLELKTPPQ